MATLILHPQELRPEEFDAYLAQGWRATGQSMYTSNYLLLDNGTMVGVLPLRMKLNDHSFSKKMRRRLRHNLEKYRVIYGPAREMGDEKIKVNEAYMALHPGKSLYNLDYHVFGEESGSPLNTWETRIYDGNELIAFSYFDLGQEAAYSKAGIYNPAYANDSLGLFTMALEVEFCKRRNIRFFYPGYASDATPMFDYKHRLGPMQFYDIRAQNWKAYGEYPDLQKPLEMVRQKLEILQEELRKAEFDSKLFVYPYMDMRYRVEGDSAYFDAPMLLYLGQQSARTYLVATYDLAFDKYFLLRTEVPTYFESRRIGYGADHVPYFSDPLRLRSVWGQGEDPLDIVDKLRSTH